MITLRDIYAGEGPSVEDVGFLYSLLRERQPQESISHTTMPTLRAHTQFVLNRPYATWRIADWWAVPVGAVYLTHRNEIGIAIRIVHQGHGMGTAVLREFLQSVKPLPAEPGLRVGHFLANINPGNLRSKRLFERNGFRLKQVTYHLP